FIFAIDCESGAGAPTKDAESYRQSLGRASDRRPGRDRTSRRRRPRTPGPALERVLERHGREAVVLRRTGRYRAVVLDAVAQDQRDIADDPRPQRGTGFRHRVRRAALDDDRLLEISRLGHDPAIVDGAAQDPVILLRAVAQLGLASTRTEPGVEEMTLAVEKAPSVTDRLGDLLRITREAVPLPVERREEEVVLAERPSRLVTEKVRFGGRLVVRRGADGREIERVSPIRKRIDDREGRVRALA